MTRFIFSFGLVTLLCGYEAKALICYKYDDGPGEDMCVAYADCTNVSRNETCQDSKDACGYGVEVRSNYPEVC